MADFTLSEGADTFPSAEDVSGDDRIFALGGDDLLDGGAGADHFDGGEGFDTVSYASALRGIFVNPMSTVPRNDGTGDTYVSIERFELSAFDDYFRGWEFAAAFEADGGAGNDRIYGSWFDDHLVGGEGNDELRGDRGEDLLEGGNGNDLLDGGEGRDRIFGQDGDDLIQSGTNDDFVDGGAGFDTMILYGDPTQYELSLLADGSVRILRRTPEYEDSGTTTLNGSADLVVNVERLRYYDGTIFDLAAWIATNTPPTGFNTVTGTEEGDVLAGTEEQDAVYGLGGDDSLTGGDGDDILYGGWGADSLDGGVGFDIVSYRNASGYVRVNFDPIGPFGQSEPFNEATYDTFASVERFELTAFNDTFRWLAEDSIQAFGHEGDDLLIGNIGDDTLDGGDGKDGIGGGDGNDLLRGGNGDDRLEGGAGDDVLDGGLGADTIIGGDGYDTITYEGRGTGVGYAIEDVEYREIEAYRLTEYNDRIRFSSADVFAGAGNDQVEGGATGGRFYGEAGNDILIASTYGSTLDGGDGDDILHSAWGSDTIEGGGGHDVVHYGRNRDEYLIERDGDTIIVAHIDSGWVDTLTGVEILSFPHPLFDERVEIDAATIGETSESIVMGDVQANVFQGSAQADMYFGMAGDDVLAGGGESDLISGGADADQVYGQDGDDGLFGGEGNDDLFGGFGNDFLDGGSGVDGLNGGSGNDIYVVDDAGDVVNEQDGGGTDQVRTALGTRAALYVLPAFVENLSGLSATGQAVSGNALNNSITMDSGNDLIVLDSGGDDFADGGAGNDFFYYGAAWTISDRTDGGLGTDTIGLMGRYDMTLGAQSLTGVERLAVYTAAGAGTNNYTFTTVDANVASGGQLFVTAASLNAAEHLIFNGSAETDGSFTVHGGGGADIVAGGAKNDYLIGNAGGDQLFGGAGADVLVGGLGADSLHGGAGGDTFRLASAAESSGFDHDVLIGFDYRVDRIDLPGSISGWTGNIGAGSLSTASFDNDLAAAVDASLQAGSAVLFRPDTGDLAGRIFAVIDSNGDGNYQAGQDYVLEILNPVIPIDTSAAFII